MTGSTRRQFLQRTAVMGAGALALPNGDLGTATGREIGIAAGAALVTGFVMMLRKPAPRPALRPGRGARIHDARAGEGRAYAQGSRILAASSREESG